MKLATINKAMRDAGIPLALHRSDRYFYFLSAYAESVSVMTPGLKIQDLRSWLSDAELAYQMIREDRRADHGTSPADEIAMLAQQGERA
jgi:hypothetical protein